VNMGKVQNSGFPCQTIVTIKEVMKSLKVLIVDDEPHARDLHAILVRSFCREILFSRNGSEAIDICKKTGDIDLIIMDKIMPGIDGYEATRLIRLFNKDVIVIALSASPEESEKDHAMAAGSNGFLYKPIDVGMLTDLIKSFFDR
jgi:CheY-like chemotaxis protein